MLAQLNNDNDYEFREDLRILIMIFLLNGGRPSHPALPQLFPTIEAPPIGTLEWEGCSKFLNQNQSSH